METITLKQLWCISDDYEVKYTPTLTVFAIDGEGAKCYRVKVRKWQTKGQLILKDRVDNPPYSHYYSTPRAAWEAYLERCKSNQSDARRRIEEIERKVRIAQERMQEAL